MKRRTLRSIDFVIPIYNEEFAIARSVETLHRRLEQLDLPSWRIVIMDNGSTDDSQLVASAAADRFERVVYHRLEVKGRGLALRHTWTRTRADASLYMDVDLSTDLAAVPEFVERLEAGHDVVVGSRLSRDSRTTRCFKRELLSRGYNLLIKALFRSRGFEDAQCGFKAVRLDRVRDLLSLVENDHWFFDTELLLVAEAAGLKVSSVPVEWVEDTDTRVRIASTVMEDLRGLARVRRSLSHKMGELRTAGAG
jgi:glycosyltransferase involved in cell wall biosynthesis